MHIYIKLPFTKYPIFAYYRIPNMLKPLGNGDIAIEMYGKMWRFWNISIKRRYINKNIFQLVKKYDTDIEKDWQNIIEKNGNKYVIDIETMKFVSEYKFIEHISKKIESTSE